MVRWLINIILPTTLSLISINWSKKPFFDFKHKFDFKYGTPFLAANYLNAKMFLFVWIFIFLYTSSLTFIINNVKLQNK